MNKLQTVKEARKKAGMTQGQLAKKLGITQPMLSAIESGRDVYYYPRLATLKRIEDALAQLIQWPNTPTSPTTIDQVLKIITTAAKHYPIDIVMEYLVRLIRNGGKDGQVKYTKI